LKTETNEQRRIRERAEQDVEDLTRWQAKKANLPKEYEEILVKAFLEATRAEFRKIAIITEQSEAEK
jgi:hypothetical protein